METITLRKSVYQINKILERKEEYCDYYKGVIKENDEKLALIISEKKDTINANRLIKIEMMKAKREIKKKHKNEKGSKTSFVLDDPLIEMRRRELGGVRYRPKDKNYVNGHPVKGELKGEDVEWRYKYVDDHQKALKENNNRIKMLEGLEQDHERHKIEAVRTINKLERDLEDGKEKLEEKKGRAVQQAKMAKERKALKAEKDRLAFNKIMFEKIGPVWLPGESEWYFSELKKQNSK